jgi:hypothetical protein
LGVSGVGALAPFQLGAVGGRRAQSPRHLALLRALECDEGQGFYCSLAVGEGTA